MNVLFHQEKVASPAVGRQATQLRLAVLVRGAHSGIDGNSHSAPGCERRLVAGISAHA
jgi:hypothetical protein